MKLARFEKILFAVNAAYILPAAAYFVSIGNYEFLLYVVQMVVVLLALAATARKSEFTIPILLGLSVWGALHMAGGGVRVGDCVLYAMELWRVAGIGDTYIFKFDQLVHAFGFGVATFAVYHILRRAMALPAPRVSLVVISVFAGMGLGAINEMIEFVPVLALSENGVGGYYNTALDLCANAFGAVVAGATILIRAKRNGKALTTPVAQG